MLQVIRDRAQGMVVWFIVGAIVLSFALFGVNDYLTGDESGFQAASVNDTDVSIYEYQVAYQNERFRMQQMLGEGADLDLFDEQIKKSALERVIDNAVLVQSALDLGFRVSDQQLASRVQAIEAFQEEGRFSKAIYEQQLRASGESPAGFEQRMRRALLADQMITGIASTSFSTPTDITESYRLSAQEREVSYFIVDKDQFGKSLKIDDAQIEERYQNNQDRYMTDEQVSVKYLELTVDQLLAQVKISDEEVEDAYEDQKTRFVTPQEVKARHILIEVGDDEAAAKAKIEEIHQQIQAGESFEKLAREQSQDIGSASDGGDLGYFSRGVMDSAFEEVAFQLQAGQVSEPVRSDFGYHLIKVEDKRGGEGKPFSEVKDELTKELQRQKAERLYVEKLEQLANVTYEIPESLEPAMDQLGLVLKTSGSFSRRGGNGIASNPKVVDAAFSNDVLQEDLNSELVELGPDRAMVLRKNEHKPASLRPLSEVKGLIESELRNELAREKAKQKADSLMADISQPADAEKQARKNNYDYKTTVWVKRTHADFNREVISKAFAMPKPQDKAVVESVALRNGDYAVVVLSDVRNPDADKIPAAEEEKIAQRLANASGVTEFTGVLQSLKDKAEIKRYPGNL